MSRKFLKLSGYWIRWRRHRRDALQAGGMPGILAWRFATIETLARRKLAHEIGRERALRADLIMSEATGQPRFYLVS